MFSRKKPLITILDSCSTYENKNLKEDGGKKPRKGRKMITKIDDNMVEKLAEVIREANEMALCGIYARVWFDFRDGDSWSTESASSNDTIRYKSKYIYEVTEVQPYSLAEIFGNDESFKEDPDEFRAWYLDEDDGENSLSQTDQAEYWARGEGAELLARLLRRENNKNQINEDMGEYADF